MLLEIIFLNTCIHKYGLFKEWVQLARTLTAPNIFSTLFLSVPYQKTGNIEEWCHYFWGDFPENTNRSAKCEIFSILNRKPPAFAYRIRPPPSEI